MSVLLQRTRDRRSDRYCWQCWHKRPMTCSVAAAICGGAGGASTARRIAGSCRMIAPIPFPSSMFAKHCNFHRSPCAPEWLPRHPYPDSPESSGSPHPPGVPAGFVSDDSSGTPALPIHHTGPRDARDPQPEGLRRPMRSGGRKRPPNEADLKFRWCVKGA